MSSTNRGYERHKTDYYITPQGCIEEFLNEWMSDLQTDKQWIGDRPDKALWLDPCAGGDTKHAMSYPSVLRKAFEADIMTLDIRQDSLAEIKSDYLTYEMKEPRPHVIITNPPFYLAQNIIEKALRDVEVGGYVVMLLRLNFLGSNARREMWARQMPESIYVHHRRMSFTEDGRTDSIEYGHFVWKKDYKPDYSKLKII